MPRSVPMVLAAILLGGCAASPGERAFDPMTFGAMADGNANDAPAIQKAIDACAAAGGGEVVLSSGRTCQVPARIGDAQP